MRTTHVRWIPSAMAVFALGPAAVHAQSDDIAIGTWVGTLVAGPQQIEIIFHVERADDGSLTGTMDVPAQGATGIPLTTAGFDDGTLSMSFPVPGGGAYEGIMDETGDLLSGTFTQGGQPFPMDLARSEEASAAPDRPQEPRPPFPYAVEDVRFENSEAGIDLAGTLTLPEGAGPFPGVVLVSGSGPQDRNEALLGHKPFLVLADHLTRSGVAVLRYDDRGIAESGGDFSTGTTEDFASDALAAVEYLGADARVNSDAIGIVGHSEGGIIGPMAAGRSDHVGFVVMLAGPGVRGLDILIEQGRLINAAAGQASPLTDFNARVQTVLAEVVAGEPDPEAASVQMHAAIVEEIDALPEGMRETVRADFPEQAIDQAITQMNSPWFRFFLHYDPRPALEQLTVPVLALFGARDLQVPPAQSADEVEAAFERGQNADATVRVLPGLNHLFQEARTGLPTEYAQIQQTFSPDALVILSDWIVERFGPASPHE
jgi:uncharacterized protein